MCEGRVIGVKYSHRGCLSSPPPPRVHGVASQGLKGAVAHLSQHNCSVICRNYSTNKDEREICFTHKFPCTRRIALASRKLSARLAIFWIIPSFGDENLGAIKTCNQSNEVQMVSAGVARVDGARLP